MSVVAFAAVIDVVTQIPFVELQIAQLLEQKRSINGLAQLVNQINNPGNNSPGNNNPNGQGNLPDNSFFDNLRFLSSIEQEIDKQVESLRALLSSLMLQQEEFSKIAAERTKDLFGLGPLLS